MFTPTTAVTKINFGTIGTWLGDVANILKAVQDGIGIGQALTGAGYTPSFGS